MATTTYDSRLHVKPLIAPSAAAGRPLARLESVTKRYGKVTALENLSLSLYPGEVVALLGPNGAGKTTAVRVLLGLVAPTSGSASIMGGNPRDSETRTVIGAMLQVTRVPETLRVRDHINLFRSYYPNPLPSAEIVRIARLDGLENKFYGRLSGGQKQRVLFGLALAGNPRLVFLDEPTVGLDIESRRALWDQIRALAAQGKTVLLTTHYLDEADALASRIIVLGKGKILAEGTPAETKQRVAGRRIRCITDLDFDFMRGLPSVLSVEQDREAVIITATKAECVVRALMCHDPALRGLEISTAGLEDAFLAITRSEAN